MLKVINTKIMQAGDMFKDINNDGVINNKGQKC
jgi:hypothetical protein